MSRIALGALAVADVAVLAGGWPRWTALGEAVRHPRQAIAVRGLDVAVGQFAGALVWLVAAWLAAALVALTAAALPGVGGRAGAPVARRLLPRALRTVLAGSAGLGVLLAPAAAMARAGSASTGDGSPAPAWPVSPAATTAPGWPIDAPRTAPGSGPPSATGTTTGTAMGTTAPPPAGAVTVRPGDSLWTIAAARLGPSANPARIAAAWPRWFAANRAVIGADPDLVRPGQVLRPPAARPEEDRP